MKTIFSGFSFGVNTNFSEDKSGIWVGSTKNDWNLTSSVKMSPFRVKYANNVMKNNTRINLWQVLYIYILVMSRIATRVDSGRAKSGRIKNFWNPSQTWKTRVKLESIMTRLTRHIFGSKSVKVKSNWLEFLTRVK